MCRILVSEVWLFYCIRTFRFQNILPVSHVLTRLNTAHSFPSYSCKIHFNNIDRQGIQITCYESN
jgi:hypothetical protein